MGFLYGLVNFTYVMGSGNVIYPDMTWTNAISYIAIIASLIMVNLAFYMGHLMYKKVKHHRIQNGLLCMQENSTDL